jgi:hypothetical protein
MELGFLSPLFDRPGPWASVYFDTTQASEDALARHELNARGAADQLKGQGADEETCEAVYDMLISLPRGQEPPGRVLFANRGEVVLDPVLTVSPPGGGPLVSWQPLPHLGPLVELADSDPPCLVAYIDRTGADFELRGPTGSREAGQVSGSGYPVHRTASGDWSERHFQFAVENNWEQNAEAVARDLAGRIEDTGAALLVLAGDNRERRSVHDRLPPDLRERTVEAEHGVRADSRQDGGAARNTAVGRRLLDEEVMRARAEFARRRAGRAMESFQAGRVPTDDGKLDAAEGVPELVEAAREHRIGSLLIRPGGPDLRREVWVGDGPEQIAVRRTENQYLGETEPSSASAEDALLRSAATTGADVLPVRREDVPEGVSGELPVGGLGALLRWPYQGAPEGGGAGGGQHATR